jgi:hypothetical protein
MFAICSFANFGAVKTPEFSDGTNFYGGSVDFLAAATDLRMMDFDGVGPLQLKDFPEFGLYGPIAKQRLLMAPSKSIKTARPSSPRPSPLQPSNPLARRGV